MSGINIDSAELHHDNSVYGCSKHVKGVYKPAQALQTKTIK